MSKIEIEVMNSKRALAAFVETWNAGTRRNTKHRLAFGSMRELFSALSERRIELLRYVGTHDGLNIKQLAKVLERDYKNVHTDVTDLIALGMLEKDESGSISAPFDEIIIHADLRQAA